MRGENQSRSHSFVGFTEKNTTTRQLRVRPIFLAVATSIFAGCVMRSSDSFIFSVYSFFFSSGYIYSYEYIQPSFWLYIYLTFKASLSFFPTAITRDSSQVLVQTAMRCCPLRRLTTNPHTSETASDWGKQTKNETVDRRGRKTKKKKNGST